VAYYRFTQPARQSDYVEFGMAIGIVCEHLKALGISITDIRLRSNKLAFNTSVDLTQDLLTHLGSLEAG
jgi:hypothetical protein